MSAVTDDTSTTHHVGLPQVSEGPDDAPDGATSSVGDVKRSVLPTRNDPVAALWVLAAIVVGLLVWAGKADPGTHAAASCHPGLKAMPFIGHNSDIGRCLSNRSLASFNRRDSLLIVAYMVLFRECFRWGGRCFGWSRLRELCRSPWRWLILAAGCVDGIEDIGFQLVRGHHSAQLYVLLRCSSGLKWALLAMPGLVSGFALLVGFWRYVQPWTVPPPLPAAMPGIMPGAAPVATAAALVTPLAPLPAPAEGVMPMPLPGRTKQDGAGPGSDGKGWFVDPRGNDFDYADYGIGLSGGGIRSAAFSAGVLQAISGTPWSLDHARYLATVSGGGYIGVATQTIRHGLYTTESAAASADPVPDLYSTDAPETQYMSANQRYLGDDATSGMRLLIASIVGILVNVAFVGGILMILGSIFAVWIERGHHPVSWSWWDVAVFAMLATAAWLWQAGTADQAKDGTRSRAAILRSVGGVLTVIGSILVVATVPLSVSGYWHGLLWLFAFAFGVGGWLAGRRSVPFRRDFWGKTSAALFSSAWITMALEIVQVTARHAPSAWMPLRGWLFWVAVAALGYFLAVPDQTWYSPYPFYKARLASTFAVRRLGGEVVPLDGAEFTYLDQWAAPVVSDGRAGPQLLVCATATSSDVSLPPTGTRATPFVFASDYVGSPELGAWTTTDFRWALGERLAASGTLQAATAISGAAVASELGSTGPIPTAGTGLALLNARLGVWLPNPAHNNASAWPRGNGFKARWNRTRRPTWLLREITGVMPSRKRFIYVSDGGHLDNLGLLELLRRRCRTIVLVDASGDKDGSTNTFDNCLTLARDHLGIQFPKRDPDKSPLHTRVEASPGSEFTFGGGFVCADCIELVEFTYPDGLRVGAEPGVIVLVKASFAETMFDVEAERLRHGWEAIQTANRLVSAGRRPSWYPWSTRNVPKTSTLNQWLSPDQYAATVAVGVAAGYQLVSRWSGPEGIPRSVDPTTVSTQAGH